MESLNKMQRAKVFPAAKAAILDYYANIKDVPQWRDIGTLVRISLREAMISQLRVSDNGDVADYLESHLNETDVFLHKKVKTLRERRYQSMYMKLWFRELGSFTVVDRRVLFRGT